MFVVSAVCTSFCGRQPGKLHFHTSSGCLLDRRAPSRENALYKRQEAGAHISRPLHNQNFLNEFAVDKSGSQHIQ